MGCTDDQGFECSGKEKSAHKLTISKDFFLMDTEVTQALYEQVMSENSSSIIGSNRPMETITWYDAVKFCNQLSEFEGLEKCYTIN